MTWQALAVLGGGTYLVRLMGLTLGDRLNLPAGITRLIDLGATALLMALAATAALTASGGFAGWARAAGVAVGALAVWRRAPFALVIVLAAGATAGLRALGVE